MPPSSEIVLDASAVLAEARARLWDQENSGQAVDGILGKIKISVVAFDAEQARLSADLRPGTRHLGLSLGDCACLALGIVKKAVVYTADRAWSKLDLPIEIKLIR